MIDTTTAIDSLNSEIIKIAMDDTLFVQIKNIPNHLNTTPWYETISFILFLDIIIPLFLYLIYKRIERIRIENKQARMGIIILDALIEEINTAIKILKDNYENACNPYSSKPLRELKLPNGSYENIKTIPFEVIEIIKREKNKEESLDVDRIHTHIKNYFLHIRENIKIDGFETTKVLYNNGDEWKKHQINYFGFEDPNEQIQGILFVHSLLTKSKEILENFLCKNKFFNSKSFIF